MGIFSSKKKTYVNTSVSRMVDDKDFVPSNKMAILSYTVSDDSLSTRIDSQSLSDYLLSATTNNLPSRAKRARRYAERPDYAYGVPQANLVLKDSVDINEVMDDYLRRTLGHPVAIKYALFGPMNNLHFLREMLVRKYDYDQVTNELKTESARLGFTCYLDTAVIRYSKYTTENLIDPDTLIQHGLSAISGQTNTRKFNATAAQVPWENSADIDHDEAVVTVSYKEGDVVKRYTITLDFLEYESSSKPVTGGLDMSDTNNFEPDAITPAVADNFDDKDFFQVFYEHEVDGVKQLDYFTYLYNSGSIPLLDNLYKSQDKLGQYFPRMYARMHGTKCNLPELKDTPAYKSMVGLGRTMSMNWSAWVDEIHKSVGSVGSVSQIFMTYAIPANTTNDLEIKYLYEYFQSLYGQLPDKFADSSYKDLHSDFISLGTKQGQSLWIEDKGYAQQLSFSALGYSDKLGSIGEVGSYTSGMGQGSVNTGRVGFRSRSRVTWHYYRKQITSTLYREYRVYSLTTVEHVSGGHTTTASGDSENLLIALDASLTDEFSRQDLEFLYTKSMYMVLHTIQVVKQKWYQTGIFKAIMFIIAVVVSYFFPPAGATMYGWMAVAYAVVQTIVISIVVQLAVKLLVNKFGVDVGAAAAIVAVIALFYGGYTGLTNTTGLAGVTTAQLMSVASNAFSMSSQGYALQAKKAVKEFNSLMADLSVEQEEMQRRIEELNLGVVGPLLMFEPPISIGVRMGESPDNYFSRSIHSINLAPTIYSFTEMHVAFGTSLPSTEKILKNIEDSFS